MSNTATASSSVIQRDRLAAVYAGSSARGQSMPPSCGRFDGQAIRIPGSTISQNVLTVPRYGRIYFGEVLIDPDERRLTMARFDLGSPDGGKAAAAESTPTVRGHRNHSSRRRPAPSTGIRLRARSRAATRRPLRDGESRTGARQAAACLAAASDGLALATAEKQSEWTWRFTLIRAEAALTDGQTAEASAAVAQTVPSGAAFDVIRARQQYLNARLLVAKHALPDARTARISPIDWPRRHRPRSWRSMSAS